VLATLARERIASLLVEGGAEVAASLIAQEYVDRLLLFYGPRTIGETGISAVGDLGVDVLDDAPRWEMVRTRRLSPDLMLELRPEENQ
jgi:diaminohydroxyphosphoribosylaminopyrimidine deaminase/5-amino-6-(5-phosphoribosylamino)uracil reductase